MIVPANLKYSKSDEWILVEENVATVGITDYAQSQLSDVVYVEITPGEGDQVEKNSAIATIESVKAAADVNSPVSGKVVAINEEISQTPETVNSDPYGAAWLIKIEFNDPAELNSLLDPTGYQAFCEERSH